MISTRKLLTVAVAGVIGLLPWVVAAQGIDNYSAVTEARLLKPEPQNWLMYRGTYDGWGYSPLDQIKTTNVKKLVPVWTLSSGMVEGHESPPIVNNGVMFLTTPQNQVLALNAKTGDVLWRYKKELPEDLTQLHPTNRGVGLLARIIHHPKNRSEKGFLKPSEASKQPYPRLVTLPKAGCQIVLTLCQAV
jgi:alcohol dehydrogenase (cytochrome c)